MKRRYSACRKFLELELECRIDAAALAVLGMESLDDIPDTTILDLDHLHKSDKAERRNALFDLSAKIVDTFIMSSDHILQQQTNLDQRENLKQKLKCSSPDCNASFKVDGKRKRDHELRKAWHNIQ